ncbi:50S ribosomal protein L18 [Candidatus Pacearchaeota archaeon]|nr:50S ribosomal protein L18 [Candidatus Pacearchaeota archaeon]
MKTIKKRKQQGKTDYKARFGFLKSNLPRIAIRKTNKYIDIQYIKSENAKDKVILNVNSKELLKNGWPKEAIGSLKSIPAAYITGFIAGKEINEKNKNARVILDIGLQRNIHGSRIYSALKGLVDAGTNISYDKKCFPSNERIEGKNLSKNVQEAFTKTIKEIKSK